MEEKKYSALQALLLTPEKISEVSLDPQKILGTLMSGGDWDQSKLGALMNRPDVTGFLAYNLLRTSLEEISSNFFRIIAKLYCDKFIAKGTQQEGLCYTLMTLQLWIHFDDSRARMILPEIGPIISVLIARWPVYQNSAVRLFEDMEEYFKGYSDKSTFPGDTESPFSFVYDNHVRKEVVQRIFPFIGQHLIQIASKGKYYQKSEDLQAFAIREYFSHSEKAGPLYIKSIESTFTLNDIKPLFSYKSNGAMETFLLSDDGKMAKNRFINLCKNASANEVFTLIRYRMNYAGFYFKENKAYSNLSLEEKAEFIKPYSHTLESNQPDKQGELLRLWINDSEWNNPKRLLSDLTLIALKKRHIFSFNREKLFIELIEVLLRRLYGKDVLHENQKRVNTIFLKKVVEGNYVDSEDYPLDSQELWFIIMLLNLKGKRYQVRLLKKQHTYTDYFYEAVNKRLNILFVEYVVTCLPKYSTDDAYEVVSKANAYHNEEAVKILIERSDLSYKQADSLMREINYERINKQSVETLKVKLIAWINSRKLNKDCLATAVSLLKNSKWGIASVDIIFQVALNRKGFSELSVLLTALREIIGDNVVDNRDGLIGDITMRAIRLKMVSHIEAHHNTREKALIFCQHQVFKGSLENWVWFYGRYPLTSLQDLNLSSLNKDLLLRIFRNESVPRNNLLNFWKAASFKSFTPEFLGDYILNNKAYFHDHPGWINLSLQERLDLFNSFCKGDHAKMLVSFKNDFADLWKKGEWTTEKYLTVVETIDPYPGNLNIFAGLVLELIT